MNLEPDVVLLLLYSGGAISVSFFCSLLEAALLSSRMIKLVERKNAGDRGAELLLEIKEHRLDDGISAILTLNTIANTIGAALAGAQARTVFGDRPLLGVITAVGVFTASLSMGVLVFSEIIPKTLGAAYATRLIGFVGRTVNFLIWLLQPFLKFTRTITRLLTRRRPSTRISRGELTAMLALAIREGALPDAESRLLSNVLRYDEIMVDDVMTPRTVIAMLPRDTTVGQLLDDEESQVFSRLPLYEENRDNVVGYVLQRDVLLAAARKKELDVPLDRFLRPALFLPEGQPLGRILRRLTEQGEHLALITDEYGGVSGLVTLEDLMETILGVEIIDELDRVADLRAEATKLRERRLAHVRRLRHEHDARLSAATSPAPDPAPPDPPVRGRDR